MVQILKLYAPFSLLPTRSFILGYEHHMTKVRVDMVIKSQEFLIYESAKNR